MHSDVSELIWYKLGMVIDTTELFISVHLSDLDPSFRSQECDGSCTVEQVEECVEGSSNLMNLLYACHLGENLELVRQADDTDDLDEVYYLHLAAPRRVSSLQNLHSHSFLR